MSRRILWSRDGTRFLAGEPPSTIAQCSQTYMDAMDVAETLPSNGYELQKGFSGDHTYPITYFIWNFPAPIQIDKITLALYGSYIGRNHKYFTTQVSSNTTNGIDGTWDTVCPQQTCNVLQVPYVFNCTPTSTRWLRWYMTGYNLSADYDKIDDWAPSYINLYGEYDTETYALYDNAGTPELITDWNNFLSLGDAYSHDLFSANKQFKIKNLDSVSHTYEIVSESGRYPFNDSLILSYYTISNDGGVTPVTSLTTASVAPGEFSEVIDVNFNLPAINNPSNGKHFMRITVEEKL